MENSSPKRYSDEDLEEFRVLINDKLDKALAEYASLKDQLQGDKSQDPSETGRQFNDIFDESSSHTQRAEIQRLMNRQQQFIEKLRGALTRIDNKTYTGELIPKDRLRAVPHATLSIEAKNK